ncbi:MAG: hypothetical protein HYY84_12430 [Deltaproteobacteria bacterium]|nr:hypothetical protein [Deltaproteobacteria bacterium]
MSEFRITQVGQAEGGALRLAVDPGRQTPREVKFSDVFKAGVRSVVETGISLGTAVVPGGPFVNASVERARTEVLGREAAQGAARLTSGDGNGTGLAAGGAGAAPASQAELLEKAWAMQRESQVHNLQYLQLQQELQEENRRFTTLSNMLKVKHDTAKAAISNIH